MTLGPSADDQWRWVEALAIERAHGQRAVAFVAQRIGALALAGDEPSFERMKQTASRVENCWPAEERHKSRIGA